MMLGLLNADDDFASYHAVLSSNVSLTVWCLHHDTCDEQLEVAVASCKVPSHALGNLLTEGYFRKYNGVNGAGVALRVVNQTADKFCHFSG